MEEGLWEGERDVDKETDTSELIEPGAFIELLVDEATTSIRLVYTPKSNLETAEDVAAIEHKLCRLITLCDPDSATNDIDISKPKQLFGQKYIELQLSDKAKAELEGTPFDFGLRIASSTGRDVLKRYSLQYPEYRETRGMYTSETQDTPHNVLSVYSIKAESFVPDYRNSYPSATAVSWAMLLRFLDRRCHWSGGGDDCSMYRSGPDGTRGNSSRTRRESTSTSTDWHVSSPSDATSVSY